MLWVRCGALNGYPQHILLLLYAKYKNLADTHSYLELCCAVSPGHSVYLNTFDSRYIPVIMSSDNARP